MSCCMRLFQIILLSLLCHAAMGKDYSCEYPDYNHKEDTDTIYQENKLEEDSCTGIQPQYTVNWQRPEPSEKKNIIQRTISALYKIVKGFNDTDDNYIEPQYYNYAVMLQNTNNYEIYRLSSRDRQNITFAPEPTIKLGPYAGWRWVFLGYTIDLRHVNFTNGDDTKKEYDISLYSSMLGIDIFYRISGNDYHIRSMSLGEGIDTSPMKGVKFSGFKSSVKGFNLYYITNHHRFSYPAAFSQSTVQRISAGSPLIGIGYTNHQLSVDWDSFSNLVREKLGRDYLELIDSTLMVKSVSYTDFSLSGGYAYNWVFAKNWLLAASLSLALSYKHSEGDVSGKWYTFRDFSFEDLSFDGIGRFGIVWNNTKWYAGMSTILHAYNYHKSRFYTNNVFGALNIYFGVNLGRKSQYRKKKG